MIGVGGLSGCVVGYLLARALSFRWACRCQLRLALIREATADEEAADVEQWDNQLKEATP